MSTSGLRARLERIEQKSGTVEVSKGLPIRPVEMSDKEYEKALKAKRKELGLRDFEVLPILCLIFPEQ